MKHKKFYLVVRLFLLIPLHPTFATFTRSAGLGLDRDVSWMANRQFPYVFENPAFLTEYQNSIYLEYYNTIKMGGIFIPLPMDSTLGIFSGTTTDVTVYNSADFQSFFHGLNDDPARIDFTNANFLGNGALSTTPLNMRAAAADIRQANANILENRNIELLAKKNFGNLFSGGLNVSYAFASDEQSFRDTQNNNEERVNLFKSEFRLLLGAVFPLDSGPLKNIAPSISFTKHSLDNVASKTLNNIPARGGYESNGAFDIGLRVRTTLRTSSSQVHLHTGYTYLNRSGRSYVTTNNATTREGDYSRVGHRLQFGAANELPLSAKITLFWGAEFFYESFRNVYKAIQIPNPTDARNFDTTIYLIRMPLVLGVGASITETLDLRFGIRHNIVNSGNNYESSTQVSNGVVVTSRAQFLSAGSSLSFGFSYEWGPLLFDWLANIALLKEGPYFISGKVNDMALAFAVTFRWEQFLGGYKK